MLLGLAMEFVYRNAAGKESLRKLEHFKEDEFYISGYCEYSNGQRTFRKDRIMAYLNNDNRADYAQAAMPESISSERRQKAQPDDLLEICFTGFAAQERKELEARAESSGLKVRKSVTNNLNLLCIGSNAGASKVKAAEDQGSCILTVDELNDLLGTGVLPESYKPKTRTKVLWKKSKEEELVQRFVSYAFEIKKGHWFALGVEWRSFTDSEATAKIRLAWEEANPRYQQLQPIFFNKPNMQDHPDYEEWQNLKKLRDQKVKKYDSYALSSPLVVDFHEGDLFFRGKEHLQVIYPNDPLEVKHGGLDGRSMGYQLTNKLLIEWLKTGVKPEGVIQISKNQSQNEIAQFHEYTE